MKESPLFWPVKFKNNIITCLDETVLPQRLIYLKARTPGQAISLIKRMKTRAFGQVAITYYIFLLHLARPKPLNATGLISAFKSLADKLNRSRPTFPFPFFTGMVLAWAGQAAEQGKDISDFTKTRIKGFLAGLRAARIEQARSLSRLLKSGDRVLTHCNVSGLLPLAADFCRKQNKKIEFVVTETRPYLQGSRLTAWELSRAGFKSTIIPDSAVALVMSSGMVNKVVTGADQMAANGDIANKIGTYQIAMLAREFNLPFYVLSPPPSSLATGQDIKIEIRPEDELLVFRGRRIAPKQVRGFYPAFDITPNELITKHITLEL